MKKLPENLKKQIGHVVDGPKGKAIITGMYFIEKAIQVRGIYFDKSYQVSEQKINEWVEATEKKLNNELDFVFGERIWNWI